MTDKEKKKCKYMISILGEQILDDESDKIEVLTEGNFLMKKDHCYIATKNMTRMHRRAFTTIS